MRSDDFPVHKNQTNELRIMTIGDSIIYGGSRTDQRMLGTDRLKRGLMQKMKEPVEVGNISCNGWGPMNEWPYIKQYGLFEADYVVLELRSGSIRQRAIPFVGDIDFPNHRPYSATWEALRRYLPKVLPLWGNRESNEGYHDPVDDPETYRANANAIKNILDTTKKNGATPYILLYWIRPEVQHANKEKGWQPKGMTEIKQLAAEEKVSVLDMYEVESRDQTFIYRDDYHLNDSGQQDLAEIMEAAIIHR